MSIIASATDFLGGTAYRVCFPNILPARQVCLLRTAAPLAKDSEEVNCCAGKVLTGWRVFPLELNNLEAVDFKMAAPGDGDVSRHSKGSKGPVIYR